MAAGFKTATVNAASVPATQTNFPSYVDLSRLGITTLAEAQSVRVYADSGKVTQWAREIVSATEMHVKIPSLTSTTSIYVDWDGSSADYAVTDTYGRNAVWSGYVAVYHYDDDPSGGVLTSSTGNYNGTAVGSMTSGDKVAGPFGYAWDFDGTNDRAHTDSNAASFDLADISITGWAKAPTSGTYPFFTIGVTSSPYNKWALQNSLFYRRTSSTTGPHITLTTNWADSTWKHVGITSKASDHKTYLNGATNGSDTDSRNLTQQDALTEVSLGGGFGYNGAMQYYAGFNAELRVSSGQLSANWILTEYNNQSAESTFWGTWTSIGGATYRSPSGSIAYNGGLTMY